MQNNFAALSTAQEPAQLIAQATGAAKNRRKKEKAKAKKAAAAQTQQDAAPPSAPAAPAKNGSTTSAPSSKPQNQPAAQNSVETLRRKLESESANFDWGVWDEWATRVRSCHISPVHLRND